MEMMSAIIAAFDEALLFTDNSYAEALQLQETLQASLNPNPSSYSPSSSSNQNSASSCDICTDDDKQDSDMFKLEGCPHSFCIVCISKHVEYKLRDNVIRISCPDQSCSNMIQPCWLRPHVAAEVLDRWEEAVAESTILASQRVRCPYGECSEILVNDDGVETESECPWCHRLLCAKCKVPWHQGLDCREFQRLNGVKREKKKLGVLAREKKWTKCPNCEVFVDKIGGCIHITCRSVERDSLFLIVFHFMHEIYIEF